jgi:tetratricopeptide (TPR) repeat protein
LNWREWRTAMPAFQKAYGLDAREESLCSWYGAYLGKLGRFDEAIRVLRGGLEQHPASFRLNQQLAVIYLWARRKDDCLAQARELVRLQPLETSSHIMLGRAWDALGNPTEALASCAAATRLHPDPAERSLRASVLFASGRKQEALALLPEAERGLTQAIERAALYARFAEVNKSLDALTQGLERMDSSILIAGVHPDLAPLAPEPRFQDFLRTIHFR